MTTDDSSRRWNRKRIRLQPRTYAEIGAVCSITIAVHSRRKIFANYKVASATVDVLRSLAEQRAVLVYAYCVMPDHVHLVLSPSSTCDIVTFVGQFKNLTQRVAWQHGVQGPFWQKSFWDHFLRAEEDLERVLDYVLNNPVRQGLVQRWGDYPSQVRWRLMCERRAGDKPPRYGLMAKHKHG